MAECQENPTSFEEKEEDFGNKLSVNTSQNDEKSHLQKCSNIIDQRENSQNNKDRQNGKDPLDPSGQAEQRSERTNSKCNANISENSSRQDPEKKQGQVRTGHKKVEASRESQARTTENSSPIRGQQGLLNSLELGSMSRNGGKQPSREDCDATKDGQEKRRTSYLEAAKTNTAQKAYTRQTTSEVKVANYSSYSMLTCFLSSQSL